ncbi:hypothetical protein LINGRAHAP2_LOCUS36437 [Linum grandiflorum]
MTKPPIGEWMFRLMVVWIEYNPLVVGVLFYSFYGPPDAYTWPPEEEEKEKPAAKSSAEEEEKPAAKSSALPNFGYLVAALAVPLLMQKLTRLNHVLLFNIPVLFHNVVLGSDGSLLSSVLVYEAAAVSMHRVCQPSF